MKSELTLLAYKLIHFNGSYLIVSIVPYKTVKWTILFRTSSSGRRWRPCAGSGRRRAPAPWCPGTRGTRARAMSAATTLLQLCSQHTHRIALPGAFSRKFVDSSKISIYLFIVIIYLQSFAITNSKIIYWVGTK